MNANEHDIDGPSPDRLLAWFVPFVPAHRRETFLGDLIEEYTTEIVPRLGFSRARWWLRGQIVRSIAPLIRWRIGKEIEMSKWGSWGAILILAMGLLQAWDSGVHRASEVVMSLVAIGIALPALAALLTRHEGVYVATVAICAALLLTAKAVSPTPLPALGVTAVIAGGILAALAISRRPRNDRTLGHPA